MTGSFSHVINSSILPADNYKIRINNSSSDIEIDNTAYLYLTLMEFGTSSPSPIDHSYIEDTDGTTKIITESTPGANDENMSFFTNSQLRLKINEIGNVGIGISNPNFLLHLNSFLF